MDLDQLSAVSDARLTIVDALDGIVLADLPADASEHLDAIEGAVADLREALGLQAAS